MLRRCAVALLRSRQTIAMTRQSVTTPQSHFSVVTKCKADEHIDVTKYQSPRTKLTVTIADAPGPMVDVFIVLATETTTDDGLPHTLEHLCFTGSKLYPYKGVLDVVANRCMASGTNAWTDQDHTAYTVTTVGSCGMLKILPIYLDHIFRPLLTNEQYLTEVHNISEQNEDGGVVYSEMQEYESDMESICSWALQELSYPPGSPYRCETGGRLVAIRELCSNARVRDFHRRYYRLCNCNIIVAGPVDHERLLQTVEQYENQLLADVEYAERHNLSQPFTRPFQEPVAPIAEKRVQRVVCPSDDESKALALFNWQGPLGTDYESMLAVEVLLDYLDKTAVSPLQVAFVQRAEPLASDVAASMNDQSTCYVKIKLSGIPIEHVDEIEATLMKVLTSIADGSTLVDMERMQAVIKQRIMDANQSMESSPSDTIGNMVIGDFLYGNSEQQMEARLNSVKVLQQLRSSDAAFWQALMRRYLGPQCVYTGVIGIPSTNEIVVREEAETQRLEKRAAELGEDGLSRLGDELERAVEIVEESMPSASVLPVDCIVNNTDDVNFVHVTHYASKHGAINAHVQHLPTLDILPVATLLDEYKTEFVELSLLISISNIPLEDRPLLLLLTELLFESPIRDRSTGALIDYETVVQQLHTDLHTHTFHPAPYTHLAELQLKAACEDYEKAIRWLRTLLHDVVIDASRIQVVAQRLLNSVAEQKRDGSQMCRVLLAHDTYNHDSQQYLFCAVRQEFYLETLLERLDADPQDIVSRIERLYKALTEQTNPTTLRILTSRKSLHTHNSKKASMKEIGKSIDEPLLRPLIAAMEGHLHGSCALEQDPPNEVQTQFGKHSITAIGASESSFIYVNCNSQCLANDADCVPLMVVCQLLSQCEGPLWKQIRGHGFAYGAYVMHDIDDGLLKLNLYRTSNPQAAYEQSRELILEYAHGKRQFESMDIVQAKRSLISDLVAAERSFDKVASMAVINRLRRAPLDYLKRTCDRVWTIDEQEIADVARRHLPRLFDSAHCNTAVVCLPAKVDDILDFFKENDIILQQYSFDECGEQHIRFT